MNAAFLLVTSAWLAGADAAADAKPPAAAPITSGAPAAPVYSSAPPAGACNGGAYGGHFGGAYGGCCDMGGWGDAGCCDNGHGLFGRLRGLFRRNNDCCGNGGGHGLFGRSRGFGHGGDCCDCAPVTSCGGCCDSCGQGLFGRLKGLFHRDRGDCCGYGGYGYGHGFGGYAGCCGVNGGIPAYGTGVHGVPGVHGAPGAPVRTEPIPVPPRGEPGKKLPNGTPEEGKQVQSMPRTTPSILEVSPARTESPF